MMVLVREVGKKGYLQGIRGRRSGKSSEHSEHKVLCTEIIEAEGNVTMWEKWAGCFTYGSSRRKLFCTSRHMMLCFLLYGYRCRPRKSSRSNLKI